MIDVSMCICFVCCSESRGRGLRVGLDMKSPCGGSSIGRLAVLLLTVQVVRSQVTCPVIPGGSDFGSGSGNIEPYSCPAIYLGIKVHPLIILRRPPPIQGSISMCQYSKLCFYPNF